MVDVASVVLGAEVPELTEEVMQFFDRSGRVSVAGTAADRDQLTQAIRQIQPDAVVAPAQMLTANGGVPSFALESRASVGSLRQAMHEGARGYFLWPSERGQLLDAVASTRSLAPVPVDGDGQIVSVLGAGGGVGTTFVATHLADAFARASRPTSLIDAGLATADLRSALGGDEAAKSIADLVPVAAELSAAHLDGVVEQHPRGFSVLHAPPTIDPPIDPRLVTATVSVAARSGQTVVVQASRDVDASAFELLESSHVAIIVLTLEVRSFQAARRTLAWLGDAAPVEFLVNRAARAEVAPHDVSRVFGRSPIAIVPAERGVGAAQDRGRLLSARSRAARIFSELATRIGDRSERAA